MGGRETEGDKYQRGSQIYTIVDTATVISPVHIVSAYLTASLLANREAVSYNMPAGVAAAGAGPCGLAGTALGLPWLLTAPIQAGG